MRKLITRLALVGSLVFVLGIADVALAKSATVLAISLGSAAPESCAVGIALSDGSIYSFFGTYKSQASASGNVIFQCRGQIAEDAPSQAINASSPEITFVCYDPESNTYGETNAWEVHVTPSGNATYKCNLKKKNT